MTVSYRYDATRNRIETRCEGHVSVVEVMNHFHLLSLDAAIGASADVLLDLETMTSKPEEDHLRAVQSQIERLTTRRPFGRCAVVAPEGPTTESARMFERFAGSRFTAYELFASREAAEAWLAH